MRFLTDERNSPIPYEIAEQDSFWTKSRQKKKDLAEKEAEKRGQVRQIWAILLLSSSFSEMKTEIFIKFKVRYSSGAIGVNLGHETVHVRITELDMVILQECEHFASLQRP